MPDTSIILDNVSKRYLREWVLKDLSYRFSNDKTYAITGPNGSGKSTLVQIISSYLTPTRGTVKYSFDGKPAEIEQVYKEVSVCAPSMDVVEEMDLMQVLKFHFVFKPITDGYSLKDIVEFLQFDPKTQFRNYSSGMKQRLKLALCFFSKASVLLLDEPTSNLDSKGVEWFEWLFNNLRQNRLLILSSNLDREIILCDEKISVVSS